MRNDGKPQKIRLLTLFVLPTRPKGWDLFGRGVQFGQKFFIPKHSHVGNCLKDNFVQKNDLKLLLLQNDTQRKL